jgi:RES domain-containing protein
VITVEIGGTYSRVADPDWDDPLDTDFSVATGGRWNAPGTFPVLYLNETLGAARANVFMRLAEQRRLGITLDMLDPLGLPVLVDVIVSPGTAVDLTSDDGLAAVGLPMSYPLDTAGERVDHARCRRVGAAAHEAQHQGIRARCAAPGAVRIDIELAWFRDKGGSAELTGKPRSFRDWF